MTRKQDSPLDSKTSKRKLQSPKTYISHLASDVRIHAVDPYLNKDKDHKTLASLSQSCFQMYSIYQPKLTQQHLKKLLQAIVDDKVEIVKKLLHAYPKILLEEPEVTWEIESQYTWQKFYAENALTIAVKRKQLEMIKVLLSYFDQLEYNAHVQDKVHIQNIKTTALSKWPSCESKETPDEIDIPVEYTSMLKKVIDILAKETLNDGVHIQNEQQLCKQTIDALQTFRETVLPKNAVKLDDYWDPEIFLYAAYRSYDEEFDELINWTQRNVYCIFILGFLQSRLTPQDAEKWCESLYGVFHKDVLISPRAKNLQLVGGQSFYRTSRDAVSGLGFDYMCGSQGRASKGGHTAITDWLAYFIFEKEAKFKELRITHMPNNDYDSQFFMLP